MNEQYNFRTLSEDTKDVLTLLVWSLGQRLQHSSIALIGNHSKKTPVLLKHRFPDFPTVHDVTDDDIEKSSYDIVLCFDTSNWDDNRFERILKIGQSIRENGVALLLVPRWSKSFPGGLTSFFQALATKELSLSAVIEFAFDDQRKSGTIDQPLLLVISRVKKNGIYFLRIPKSRLTNYLLGNELFLRVSSYIESQLIRDDLEVRGHFSSEQIKSHLRYGKAFDALAAEIEKLSFDQSNGKIPDELKPLQLEVNDALTEVYRLDDIDDGIYRIASAFKGFDHFDLYKQFISRGTDYFRHAVPRRLREIADISFEGGEGCNSDRTLWLLSRENLIAVDKLCDKHRSSQSVIGIKVKCDEVSRDFLVELFNSQFGQSLLNLNCGTVLRDQSQLIEALGDLEIYIPDSLHQVKIVEQGLRIRLVEKTLEDIRLQIATNPISSEGASKKLELIHAAVTELSDSERLQIAIRGGETKKLEFKQTFSMCIQSKERREEIAQAALKSVAGMLNQDGGVLLIGVADDGNVVGVKEELARHWRSSTDKFINGIKDKLKSKLGAAAVTLLDFKVVIIQESLIVCVESNPSDRPIYYGEHSKFYARVGPSTEELSGPHLVDFVGRRFVRQG